MILEYFGHHWLPYAVLSLPFVLCAWLAGQSQAASWHGSRRALIYGLLIGLLHSFPFRVVLTPKGFDRIEDWSFVIIMLLAAVVFCCGLSLMAYKTTQAAKMELQYPWLYRRTGLFGWTEVNQSK